MEVRITRQDNAKSPGSDGASPHLPRLLSPQRIVSLEKFRIV
jgi:hypothetical protein